jgi:hypothetical protein
MGFAGRIRKQVLCWQRNTAPGFVFILRPVPAPGCLKLNAAQRIEAEIP